jgi:hypothetical protein
MVIIKFSIYLPDSSQFRLLQKIKILLFVPHTILLHGKQSGVIFLSFFEVVPVVKVEPVVLVV